MESLFLPSKLVNASYKLPLNSRRLLYLGISKLSELSFFICYAPPVVIMATEWQEIFLDSENPYRDLQRAVKQLREANIIFEGSKDSVKFVSRAEYFSGNGYVELDFTPELLAQCR